MSKSIDVAVLGDEYITKRDSSITNYSATTILDQEIGLGILLRAISLGIGCLIYFSFSYEPPWHLSVIFCILSFPLIFSGYLTHYVKDILLILFFLSLGIALSGFRTQSIDTQFIPSPLSATVTGRVLSVEHQVSGRIRYTLSIEPSGIFHTDTRGFTGKVRLSDSNGGPEARIGDTLSGYARLSPPSGPAYPDSYSPSFHHWFSGIGATGFYLGHPLKVSGTGGSGFWERIDELRYSISRTVRTTLPDRTGGLAAALIVGDRSGIDKTTNQSLRATGLAHILAISGLHMALVALTIMISLRFLFVLSSNFVSAINARKLAAISALFLTFIYLLLSGGSVSAQRAFIMIAIMLLAILFDRRAISMRNVAFAFMLVLFISPSSILSAGFHLSFVAVTALVAVYEALGRISRRNNWYEYFSTLNFLQRFLMRDVAGIALTSLIAGLSTAIFTAYHFHFVAPYALLSNLLAMPIVSILLMPSIVVSVLLMPFGLHIFPLYLTSIFIEAIVFIAEYVESLDSGSIGLVGYIPSWLLLFSLSGFLILCLFRSRLRYLGIPIIVSSLFFVPYIESPDILISENGGQVGIVSNGELSLMRPNSQKYVSDIWRRTFSPTSSSDPNLFDCTDSGCVADIAGRVISIPNDSSTLPDACNSSDILILTFPYSSSVCPDTSPLIIVTSADLRRYGSHSIFVSSLSVRRSYGLHLRPWSFHRLVN